MKKLFIQSTTSILLISSIISTQVQPVFASQLPKEKVVSEEYANEQKKLNPRYGENEKVTVVNTEYKTVTVTPSGQNPGGYNFPNGGGLYINTAKGSNQSFSVGVSWGIASFSVSIGQASKTSSVGGTYVKFPADNNYYIVKINKKMKIERHKVDVYQYNEYKYTYYTTIPSLYSESFSLSKV